MSPSRARARWAAPVAGLAAALLVAGCGTGQKAQTYQERTVADATNDAVGSIAVRNLAVEGPAQGTVLRKGSDAPLSVTMVNQGGDDDRLVQASTPAASSVDVQGPSSTFTLPRLQAADQRYSLVLRGLTRDLPTGTYISLTLTFQRNGTKTMLVPVEVTPGGVPRKELDRPSDEVDSAGSPIAGDNTPDTQGDPQGDNGNRSPASE